MKCQEVLQWHFTVRWQQSRQLCEISSARFWKMWQHYVIVRWQYFPFNAYKRRFIFYKISNRLELDINVNMQGRLYIQSLTIMPYRNYRVYIGHFIRQAPIGQRLIKKPNFSSLKCDSSVIVPHLVHFIINLSVKKYMYDLFLILMSRKIL